MLIFIFILTHSVYDFNGNFKWPRLTKKQG